MPDDCRLGVIGAGAWGTALAQVFAGEKSPTLLWTRNDGLVQSINSDHRNRRYLPAIELSGSVRATGRLAEMVDRSVLLLVTPAQHARMILSALPPFTGDLVLCSKGIESGTGNLISEVARAEQPDAAIAVLSGPTFAHEVAAGLPTAVTLACSGGEAQWTRLSAALARPSFRPYFSADVIGAQVGGAVKNVLAVGCGVVAGLGLGENARAALIARGFAEMLRFGEALGAKRETLAGLCGLGDLVLSCSSRWSRNFSFGKALGEGANAAELMANRTTVAEGTSTAPVLVEIAAKLGIILPIGTAVYRLLSGASAPEVVDELLARPLAAEGGAGLCLMGWTPPDGIDVPR